MTVVRKLVAGAGAVSAPVAESAKTEAPAANGVSSATTDDVAQADVAAQVADTAEKLDSNEAKAVV